MLKKRFSYTVAIAIAISLAATSAFADSDEGGGMEPEKGAALVVTAPVQQKTLTETITAYGTVQSDPAQVHNTAMPREGIITNVFVRPGQIVKAGDPVDDAPVWLGQSAKVPATTAADVHVTLPKKARRDLKVTAVYDGEVKAPVTQGEPVGKLVLSAPDTDPMEFTLVAAQPVAQLNPLGRAAAAAGYLLWGRR